MSLKPLPEKKYRIRYFRGRHCIRVLVPDTRKGVCAGGHTIDGRRHNHHWKNVYTFDQVRKNPLLALEYLSEVCFHCHRVADALTLCAEFAVKHPERFVSLLSAMPVDMRSVLRKMI